MKIFRTIAYLVAIPALVAVALVAAVPTLLSSNWGKEQILHIANKYIPGQVSIQNLQLSWFGEQTLQGLKLDDPEGKTIAKADEVSFSTPLYRLLVKQDFGGAAKVKQLAASLAMTKKGAININEALGIPTKGIKEGVTFTPIVVSDVNADIQLQNLSQFTVKASGNTEQGTIKGNFAIEGQGGKTPHISLKASRFPLAMLDQVVSMYYPEQAGLYLLAIGETLDFTIDQTFSDSSSHFAINLQAPNVSTQVKGELKEGSLRFETPFDIPFTVTPAFYQRLQQLSGTEKPSEILQPMPGKLSFSTLVFRLGKEKLDLWQSQIDSTLLMGPVTVKLPETGNIDLSQMQFTAVVAPDSPKIKTTVKGQGNQNGSPISVDFQANIQKPTSGASLTLLQIIQSLQFQAKIQGLSYLDKQWNADVKGEIKGSELLATLGVSSSQIALPLIEAKVNNLQWDELLANYRQSKVIKASLDMPNIPSTFLNSLVKGKDLTPLLGQSLSLKASLELNHLAQGNINVMIQSPTMEASASLAVAEHLQAQSGSNSPWIKLKLNPDQFASLHQQWISQGTDKALLTLAKPTTILVSLPKLKVNLNQLAASDVHAKIDLKDIALVDTVNSRKITLDSVQGNFKTDASKQNLSWQIAVNGQGEGKVSLTGLLPLAFILDSKFRMQDLNFDAKLDGQGIPVGVLARFGGLDVGWSKALEAAIGKKASLKGDIALQNLYGPITANIQGENGQITLNGQIRRGVLVLSEPLTAKFNVNTQFGHDALGHVLPILNSAVGAENPIYVQINPQGFAMPLMPYDFNGMSFQNAMINLGKMRFSNQGDLANLLAILNIRSQDSLGVWFTPVYLSLNQGKVKIERFDMLVANRYPIAAWGNVDFPADRVWMKIGLTGQAISKALGVRGLDADDMLQVPVKGTINNPQMDTASVAAQVSKLTLENDLPEGRLIGTILGIASNVLGGDNTIPPPTTQPLPWANEKDEQAKPKKKKDVIDHVEKGVNNLINSLIPKGL